MIGRVFRSVIAIAFFHGACAALTSDESIAACDALSCPERKSLLQAKWAKEEKQRTEGQLDISGDPDATGNTATLDEAGFVKVRACSCPAQMREFIRRLVVADSNAVCAEGGLEGLTLFYYSDEYPENDFLSLKVAVGPGGAAQIDPKCPWIAPTDLCGQLDFGSCPSFPGATNPPCIGCTEMTTTTLPTSTTTQATPTTTTTTTQAPTLMLWKAGKHGNGVDETLSKTYTVESGVAYRIGKLEILRNDLAHSSEYVKSIKINGAELGKCDPGGGDYDCTFYDCMTSQLNTYDFTSTSTQLEIEITWTGHSWDCDCDETTWECSMESTVVGRTPVTAVARIQLAKIPM